MIGNDSAEVYYRINVTIPLFDEVLESIKARVGSNQGEVAQVFILFKHICLLKLPGKHFLPLSFPFMQKICLLSTHYMLSLTYGMKNGKSIERLN